MNQKSLGALELDEGVHHFFWREKLDRAVITCRYVCAKCGEISKARRVFGEMPKKETATWNALINGHASEALEAFSEMQQEGNKPNYDINMIGVFSACCHGRIWAYPKK
jgi:palmitoyl-protein thioesterase